MQNDHLNSHKKLLEDLDVLHGKINADEAEDIADNTKIVSLNITWDCKSFTLPGEFVIYRIDNMFTKLYSLSLSPSEVFFLLISSPLAMTFQYRQVWITFSRSGISR